MNRVLVFSFLTSSVIEILFLSALAERPIRMTRGRERDSRTVSVSLRSKQGGNKAHKHTSIRSLSQSVTDGSNRDESTGRPSESQEAGGLVLGNYPAIPIFTPAPVIPTLLQDQELNMSVLIEFDVSEKGEVYPVLMTKSGSDELDAVALRTAKRWRFQPAQAKGIPVRSKIRLRIAFEVQ